MFFFFIACDSDRSHGKLLAAELIFMSDSRLPRNILSLNQEVFRLSSFSHANKINFSHLKCFIMKFKFYFLMIVNAAVAE